MQFSFSFVETHAVSAVKIRPQSLVCWSEEEEEEEESEEERNSKTSPIIQPQGVTFPWNIDGELVEMASEVLVRLVEKHQYVRVGSSSRSTSRLPEADWSMMSTSYRDTC